MGRAPAKTLEINGLAKTYHISRRSIPAVRHFTLRVAPGEFVTLLGPSGCGKTTVLRCLAGLEEPDAGEILLDTRSITKLPAHQRRIGLVFQNYALFPHMSVFENVAYSLRIRRAAETTVRAEVRNALKTVDLDGMDARLPGNLSGGQQQRVALARALVMKPDLLLFDEPLSNLDAKLRLQVRSELRRLQNRVGTTALYVTHDQDEAMSLSDRIVVMREGEVEQAGTPEEIYARPANLFVADFVGQVNALPGRIVDRRNGRLSVETLNQRVELSGTFVESADVLVLVRPEAVRLGQPAQDGIAGIVEEIEYRGDRIEYRIRVGTLLIIAVELLLRSSSRINHGDRVGIVLMEEGMHVLPAEASMANQRNGVQPS